MTTILDPNAAAQGRSQGSGEARGEAWFTTLYDDSHETVHRYASVLVRDPDLADDVVAETFLRVWRARATYRGQGTAVAWVLTIARNCALNALQARKNEIDLALVGEPEDTQLPGFGVDEYESIRWALSLLTLEQQQVIVLRFFKDMPHEAVARAMGRNPVAIRAIQFRALTRLRRILEAGDGCLSDRSTSPTSLRGRRAELEGRIAKLELQPVWLTSQGLTLSGNAIPTG